jgi:hypothetical protein
MKGDVTKRSAAVSTHTAQADRKQGNREVVFTDAILARTTLKRRQAPIQAQS